MGQIIGIHIQNGAVLAYTAEPQLADRSGSILLLHDIWGLDDHIKNVADRLAAQGYHVLAPNMLAGTEMEKRMRPELQADLFSMSMRRRRLAQAQLQTAIAPLKYPHIISQAIVRVHACFEYMYNQPALRGGVSVMGFGFGGAQALGLAVREPRLGTVVEFYANVTYVAWELRHIQCPVLGFYGDKDMDNMPSFVRLRPQMQTAGVAFTPVIYEGANNYFFNSDVPGAYDDHATADAWSRSMSFLRKNMG